MKIVHVLGWYFPESLGGTEVYVHGLSQRCQEAGHDVVVVAPQPGLQSSRTYVHDGINVFRFPSPACSTRSELQGLTPVRGTEVFHRWLREQRPNVVHFHTLTTALSLPELKEAKKVGARVIVTSHTSGLGYLCQRGSMMRWGESLCDGIAEPSKCSACVLHARGLPAYVSQAFGFVPSALGRQLRRVPGRLSTALGMTDYINRNIHRQRDLIETIDEFVVLTKWAHDVLLANGAASEKVTINRLGISQRAIPRKLGVNERPTERPVIIAYIGRFDPIKGVYDLARALSCIPGDVPYKARFLGPVNCDAEKKVLSDLQDFLAYNPKVQFCPPVSVQEIPKVLSEIDVLCCPSICTEGGPTVALEAHAVGTPVIGTKVGGLAELIVDQLNGALVAPGEWQALACLLEKIFVAPKSTIDKWRQAITFPRTMDDVAADYLCLYSSDKVRSYTLGI